MIIPQIVLKQLVDDPRIFEKQRGQNRKIIFLTKNLTTKCPTPQNTNDKKSCENALSKGTKVDEKLYGLAKVTLVSLWNS